MTKDANDSGRVVAIAGGTGGIGIAIARGFAELNYSIALIAHREEALIKASMDPAFAKVPVATIRADISDAKACASAMQQVLDKLGRVDVLVNSAGVGFSSPLTELSVEDIDDVLDVNTRAPILMSRAIVPHMVERGSGSIISISSVSAKLGAANIAPYSASKAALVGFTRALAIELAPKGVRVNAVCPGGTHTPLMDKNIRNTMQQKGIGYDEALAEWVRNVPTRELLEPQDVANAVIFLASDRARKITGEALNVSAGVVMW